MKTPSWNTATAALALALATAACGQEEDGTLLEPTPVRLGTVLPQTGSLSAIVGALENPIRMGVDEIDSVSPGLVEVVYGDSGTDPGVAEATVETHLDDGVSGLLGAAITGVSLAIVDRAQTEQVAMCSGSNTAAGLSAPEYDPYYSRTSPSDLLQAKALASLVASRDPGSVAVLWRADDYGEELGAIVAAELGEAAVLAQGYDPDADAFGSEARAVLDSDAAALVLITFEEGGRLLQDLESSGFSGAIYVLDGFKDAVGPGEVGGDTALLEGITGISPSLAPDHGEETFGNRLQDAFPGTPLIFSAHYYDCLVTTVLAVQLAQSADPTVFVDRIGDVTRSGEKCSLFEDCLDLVLQGTDIDYDGASGPLEFGPNDEPTVGAFDVYVYGSSGTPDTIDEIVEPG